MERFYITRSGNLFSSVKAEEGTGAPENQWMTLDIDYQHYSADVNKSDRIISVEVKNHEPTWSAFHFGTIINGRYKSRFILGWEVRDKENNCQICLIQGKVPSIYWSGSSIAREIVLFLNILYQYENLIDYKASNDFQNDSLWETKDICEKILQLANVINLYTKYKEINPALGIVKQMESLIEQKLLSLTTESK